VSARFVSAVILAAGCVVVAACSSPAYPHAAAAPAGPAHATIAGPAHATIAAVPGSVLGVYNDGAPRSYKLVEKFASAVGRQPNVVMYFSDWGEIFQDSFARTARRHGAIPFVEMEPATVSMASIAAGHQDNYLRSYAQEVRGFGHPVMIGFAHEMNGPWYPWGWTHTRPKVFISAWRHLVTIFRQVGADNVTWLWVINGLAPNEAPIRDWWPGSHYVSWIGMDCYYEEPTQTFATLFRPTLAAIHKFTHKPVLIAETGVGQVAGQAAKIPGLFAGIRARHLLGLVWFDKAQHYGINHQDWQLEGHKAAITAFRKEVRTYR
jgi:mannan endo-1,4-beta-mannosidase